MTDPTVALADLLEVAPDAVLIARRETELTPPAGRPAAPVRETVRLVRYGRIVMRTIHAAEPFDGDVLHEIHPDDEAARVAFGNAAEALRRDGWTDDKGSPF